VFEILRALAAEGAFMRADKRLTVGRKRPFAMHASNFHFQRQSGASLLHGKLPSKLKYFVSVKILALIGAR